MQQRANEVRKNTRNLPPKKIIFWLIRHLGVKFDECSTQCCQCQHWCLEEVHSFVHSFIHSSTQSTSTTTTLELEGSFVGFGDHVVTEFFWRGKTTLLPDMMEWCQIFSSAICQCWKQTALFSSMYWMEDSIIDNSTLINWLFACRYVRGMQTASGFLAPFWP